MEFWDTSRNGEVIKKAINIWKIDQMKITKLRTLKSLNHLFTDKYIYCLFQTTTFLPKAHLCKMAEIGDLFMRNCLIEFLDIDHPSTIEKNNVVRVERQRSYALFALSSNNAISQ